MKPSDMNNHDLLAEYDEVRDTPIPGLETIKIIELQHRREELRKEILKRLGFYRRSWRLFIKKGQDKLEKGENSEKV